MFMGKCKEHTDTAPYMEVKTNERLCLYREPRTGTDLSPDRDQPGVNETGYAAGRARKNKAENRRKDERRMPL